ncbi:MAG TPA: bifunctional [glutamate--ammonia ligase]-adenylyl-L-tyrosine phosphorylase/[glutamate--ammonia-ligase] adenylyltransferase [Chthoniobacterales bacterium]
MHGAEGWIREKADSSFDPARVETALIGLTKAWPEKLPPLRQVVEDFALGEANLIHLLAASDVCASRLLSDPSLLLWLNRREISMAPRDFAEMTADLHRTAGDSLAPENFRALRKWKAREMVRIALREIANAARLEQTTAELSQIAEICIRSVYEHWNTELRKRFGSPEAEFAILALGKLGGRELNYSSDVDLIFLYDAEGELSPRLSYHEFFNRLSKAILETFSAPAPEGLFLRVDLRLRPEGSAGPLARSLESMEHYYGGFGETWERLALIKARRIAGSRETAYEFLRQHQPFIYPKSPPPDLLAEIANIKRRIERDVLAKEELERNVKLGRGGIREIEFVVQTLQFIHGARHTFLQEPSTLKALRGLAELELIPRTEILELDRAYRFLRQTEHRLQIEAEQQTHTVPVSPPALLRLARSLGFPESEAFKVALHHELQAVRSIFNRIITEAPQAREATFAGYGFFSNPAQAERTMAAALQGARNTHVSPRTRQVFAKLRPLLLNHLAKSPDPDAALNQFVHFVEAYGLRSLLFELLVTNPKLLEVLVQTFNASRFGGDLLVRRPQFLEDVTRDERLSRPVGIEEHLQRLALVSQKGDPLEAVRAYRQRQLLRILLRDVMGWSELDTLFQEQSDLAEACLIFVNDLLGGKNLTIIALGKFGGHEITYGADLDVLFVGEEGAAAQKLLATLSQPSAEGSLSRVDARLRPEGEKGPLASSLESYVAYYSSRAQPWELQALTRARPVTGPRQEEFMNVARAAWARAGGEADLGRNIDSMLERIRRERGTGSEFLDFKTGTGGMIEAEFLVQALQMGSQLWRTNWSQAVTELGAAGHLSKEETTELKRAYDVLRRCESALRRYENTSASALPAEVNQQALLARRLGASSLEVFRQEYEAARLAIHQIYQRRVKPSP